MGRSHVEARAARDLDFLFIEGSRRAVNALVHNLNNNPKVFEIFTSSCQVSASAPSSQGSQLRNKLDPYQLRICSELASIRQRLYDLSKIEIDKAIEQYKKAKKQMSKMFDCLDDIPASIADPNGLRVPRHNQAAMVASARAAHKAGKAVEGLAPEEVGVIISQRIIELEREKAGLGRCGCTCADTKKGITKSTDTDEKLVIRLVELLQQTTMKKGFLISTSYAVKFLHLYDNKVVRALRAMEEDLTKRENDFEESGRISMDILVPWEMEFKTPWTRDEAILFLEQEDRHIREFSIKTMASFLGAMVIGGKPHTSEWFDLYTRESEYRDGRAAHYKRQKARIAAGELTKADMINSMLLYDNFSAKEDLNQGEDSEISTGEAVQTGTASEDQDEDRGISAGEGIQAGTKSEDQDNELAMSVSSYHSARHTRTGSEIGAACGVEVENLRSMLAGLGIEDGKKPAKEGREPVQEEAEHCKATEEPFVLPDEFPFQGDIPAMTDDERHEYMASMMLFMEKLKGKASGGGSK